MDPKTALSLTSNASLSRAVAKHLKLRVLLSGAAGAVTSVVAAFLVTCALLDIERFIWAQWLYTAAHGMAVVLLASPEGREVVPDFIVRIPLMLLCAATSVLSFSASRFTTASQQVRVVVFGIMGTGQSTSLVFSSMIFLRLSTDYSRGELSRGELTKGLVTPQQLAAVSVCALVGGAYFGIALGFLEKDGHRRLALPHEEPGVVLPVAALLGGLCGLCVEHSRQVSDPAYVHMVELSVFASECGAVCSDEMAPLKGEKPYGSMS